MVLYRIFIKEKTFKKFHECRDLFVKIHPEFANVTLTQDFILDRLCESYYERMQWKLPLRELK